MLNSIIIMDDIFTNEVYLKNTQIEISKLTNVVSKPITTDQLAKNLNILEDVDVIFSGWGAPHFSKEVIDAAPNLKIVFYAAGTIKNVVSNEFWEKGIRIVTANTANAVPVAEFTLACTILGLKNAVNMENQIKATRKYPPAGTKNITGGFNATIGLISLGAIAKLTLELFKQFDYNVITYDPYLSDNEANELGAKKVNLDTIFKIADVVSLHTPLLHSTRGMIKKEHFLMMKDNATFINTSRGAVVNELEMINVLKSRKDITAFLDVVYPEPPKEDSPLYEMENVRLTPHIAGSEGSEVARMGDLMLKEFKTYLENKDLKYEITKEAFERMA